MYNFNNCQSSIEDLELNKYSKEVQEQFYACLNSIPYIQELVSTNRPYAKDLARDDKGRIIVDITKPHILEDMDYFRPSALYYKQNKCYTKLRPNPNPNSEFGKWIREESRRCFEGYVRPSDGEWITGDMYFFLNYCPIQVSRKTSKSSKKAQRIIDFPDIWEGHYYKFHYLQQAREAGKHSLELSRRGSGKSFTGASLLAKRFVLGESEEVNRRVQCVVSAAEKKHLTGANKILDMFVYYIDYLAQTMQWPSARLSNSLQLMQWTMGYIDSNTNTRKGTENAVTGISSKDDESKLRGSRGMLYILEEIGSFPRLLSLYNVLRPSVEDGENVFGLIHLQGTAGDSESDFSSAQELMYNPQGYNLYAIKNVYDKEGQGKKYFTFFFPGYLNRANCYDPSGNSDVTKALLQILANREVVKYGTTDINSVTKCISEIPITPQEAVIRTRGNIFPINDLNARINQLDNDPSSYDDDYIGTLVFNKNHEVEFVPTSDIPIRNFPLKDNKCKGAIEIYMLPEKDRNGKVFPNRYIAGHDPVDDDYSNTLSLVSTFVLDLWTDTIVAEYTGRQDTADENFEIVRRLCLFYNARCLYENNKKGIFAYFSKMSSLYLLADTPEYLRDKNLIKEQLLGNKSKGVNASKPINDYANSRIKEWLIKPIDTIVKKDGTDTETKVLNLYRVKCRALLKELSLYNPEINVDRVRALGMVMLYREEFMINYQGDPASAKERMEKDYLGDDPFFKNNYDARHIIKKNKFIEQ